jgi:colanic acid/amylovoran biosynthesis glycosyltransferase
MGAQPQDIVIKMLQNSDVFVLSSLNEGLPIVCMEAMAMSVFMIATKINGVPELIEDKVTGLLVEPNNISDLVGAIFWVDRNRDKAKNMCALTRKKIELEFNRKKCTEALIKNAEKIVNS